MKKLLLILLLILVSCKTKTHKYKIEGVVETKNGGIPKTWYTDTINFDNDTIYYYTNEGVEERIYPPYVLKLTEI